MTGPDSNAGQLGFDALLKDAETDNRARRFERETAHLPGTMADALPYFRLLTGKHHAAMLAADAAETMRLREEADLLALRLNGGNPGILAGPDAPGCVLERETAAAPGAVPLWGQYGEFVIAVGAMKVRNELDGMFGITSGVCFWPGFAAHAVDYDRPFLSETGYRSFLGLHADPAPDLLPGEFAARVIESYVARELKGRLVTRALYRRMAQGAEGRQARDLHRRQPCAEGRGLPDPLCRSAPGAKAAGRAAA